MLAQFNGAVAVSRPPPEIGSGPGTHLESAVTVQLNSWQFIALATSAALFLPVAGPGPRAILFIGLNLVFAWTYWGASGMPVAAGYCLLGYGAAVVVRRRPAMLSAALVALIGSFIYLRGDSLEGLTATGQPSTAGVLAFAGLSFLFFKIVHVVVDAAGGGADRLPLWSYVAYCTNFTTLLMGPIQRYQDFLAQWYRPDYGQASIEDKIDATNRVLRGMVKAFAVAPWMHYLVLRPGLDIETLGAVDLLGRIYAFYIYLYLDFSGYCDIMIGVGRLMGVAPPENFRFPFLARNVSEYWLRVHRSLTLWLTDYVFNPAYRAALSSTLLGRHAFAALALCLLLTMLVAGIWHGTTLNFVAFGLVHGIALVVFRGWEQVMGRWMGRVKFRAFQQRWIVTAAGVFLTYNFTSLAYTFFVLNLHDSLRVFRRLAGLAAGALA